MLLCFIADTNRLTGPHVPCQSHRHALRLVLLPLDHHGLVDGEDRRLVGTSNGGHELPRSEVGALEDRVVPGDAENEGEAADGVPLGDPVQRSGRTEVQGDQEGAIGSLKRVVQGRFVHQDRGHEALELAGYGTSVVDEHGGNVLCCKQVELEGMPCLPALRVSDLHRQIVPARSKGRRSHGNSKAPPPKLQLSFPQDGAAQQDRARHGLRSLFKGPGRREVDEVMEGLEGVGEEEELGLHEERRELVDRKDVQDEGP
mmetsp:Transcript_28239/g.63930  ORF Transcript_28239/g.63930 Transcript_28239/m.63930 type:complete len:258 (-) Transcript_28239:718-1491(-)